MKKNRMGIRNALYEAPGPKSRKWIAVGTLLSVFAILFLIWLVLRQFYISGQLDAKYWSFFAKITTWRFLGEGLLGTLEAAIGAGIMALAFGLILMLGRFSDSRILRGICTALVEFTRGVPTLLFVYFFFLVVPQAGIKLSAYWKIALPVAISATGMVSEVLRSGIQAVPKGQKEAAMALGMRKWRIFFRILFPQAVRYVIPALISDLVIVVKDTTFAYVVNFADIMQNAKVLISNYDAMLSVYLVVAVIYILINYLLNKLAVNLDRSNKGTKNRKGEVDAVRKKLSGSNY